MTNPIDLDALVADIPVVRGLRGEAADQRLAIVQASALLSIAYSLERVADALSIPAAIVEPAPLFDPEAFADELDAKLAEFEPAPDDEVVKAAELVVDKAAKKASKKTLAEKLAKAAEEKLAASKAAFLDDDDDDDDEPDSGDEGEEFRI